MNATRTIPIINHHCGICGAVLAAGYPKYPPPENILELHRIWHESNDAHPAASSTSYSTRLTS